MKLDQKTELHYREKAMNQALATHESQPQRSADETLDTAEKYFRFLSSHAMSADVDMADLSGIPTTELQELRRIKLLELDVISNALRSRGVMPA